MSAYDTTHRDQKLLIIYLLVQPETIVFGRRAYVLLACIFFFRLV